MRVRLNNNAPNKYQPLRLLDEDFFMGTRVHRLRDKAWIFLFGSIIVLLLGVTLRVKSKPHDFEPMRHPLASTHVPKNDSTIRYLTFGSLDSHGHGLTDHRMAYPYLLSDDVHNAAIHIGGPALGAVCTESMTGAGIYDVVVLDFAERLSQGFRVLAKRLRQRFPNALIIIVRRWNPEHIAHSPMNGSRVDAITWLKDRGISTFHSQQFLDAFNTTDPQDWIYRHHKDEFYHAIAEQINARLVELRKPQAAASALVELMHLFHPLIPKALSEYGHQVVADLVRSVVDQEDVLQQDMDVRNTVGTWAPGDKCHLWYTTGVVEEDMYKPPTKMVRFAKATGGYHYALEFPSTGGIITVTNPFDIPRALYLTFITVTTLSSEYPRVQITIGDRDGLLLITTEEDNHTPRTVMVGFVDPGSTIVGFKSLTNNMNKFHVTGASLLGTTEVPFEHTLEEEIDF